MYASVRQRLQEGVKQQILTNYYLNKYDKFMSNNSKQKYSSNLNRSSFNKSRESKSQRKNFKRLLLAKKQKYQQKSIQKDQGYSSLNKNASKTKNFKAELQERKNDKKQLKQNYVNFLKLQSSIINELYSPSPSKLESGKYNSIQIKHKTQFEERTSPFMLIPTEDQDPIQIIEFDEKQEDMELELQINNDKHEEELARISQAIKSRFQKRKSRKSQQSSPSKTQRSSPNNYKSPRYPPKYNSVGKQKEKSVEKLRESEKQRERQRQIQIELQKNEERNQFLNEEPQYNEENVRQIFHQIDKQMKNSKNSLYDDHDKSSVYDDKKSSRPRSKSKISLNRSFTSNKFGNSRFNFKESDKRSQYSHYSRQSRQSKYSRYSKYTESKRSQHNSSQQDSLNQILPEFAQLKKQQEVQVFENRSSDNRSSLGDRPTEEFRQSTNELSMISRFSMTNDEGTLIKQHLQRQINENEFGPYQNALANLSDLIDDYPNAWPIFVVGQRILQDRQQYDEKRAKQNEQILSQQSKILKQKRAVTKRQKTMNQRERNKLTILRLVRRLSQIIY